MPATEARKLENQVAQRADRPVPCQPPGYCEPVPSCHKSFVGTGAAGASLGAVPAGRRAERGKSILEEIMVSSNVRLRTFLDLQERVG